ncbi:MAG TPA: PsiF family protein [Pseudolabrys sp.]|jgi:hypothetical protein|nr:PsiF family protein [Pseudolabrys sp.]
MLRKIALTALIPLLALATPALAATKEQKMETCKVGADSDNLTGAKRDAFMKKCMGSGNYEPAARKEAMKKAAAEKKMKKKPAPKAAAVPPPPDAEAKPKQ